MEAHIFSLDIYENPNTIECHANISCIPVPFEFAEFECL
jgi:hypothetical protein